MPLRISISLEVPTNCLIVAPVPNAVIIPLPDKPAKADAIPSNAIVGLPLTPLPLVIVKPLPETATDRGVNVVEFVFANIPVLADTKLAKAPVGEILKLLCAVRSPGQYMIAM